MNHPAGQRRRRHGALAGWPARVAFALLGAWMAALGVAAVKLDAWNDELVHTLLQIRADAAFQDRMAQRGQAIPREWYRNKALALLSAADKLQDDTTWTLVMPGSWRSFDNLKERVGQRIERAFNEIAVEAVRRELLFRTSQVTGVPLDGRTGELLVGRGCAAPPVHDNLDYVARPAVAPQELPEYIAMENYLAAASELDRALQAMSGLRQPSPADEENVRRLVRYALGAELPGRLARSAAFFRTGLKPGDAAQAPPSTGQVRQALRCSLARGMGALDSRMFERNDLLATEAYLAQRERRLFAAGARPATFAVTLQGYQEVIDVLNQQEALLSRGDYGWIRGDAATLGPAHEALLERMSNIGLLGPEAVAQVRSESAVSLRRLRGEYQAAFAREGEPGLVWLDDRGGHFALSAQRLALRDALTALLREPFMADPGARDWPAGPAVPLSWDMSKLEQAMALEDERRRFAEDDLPRFPPQVRASVARFVESHLALWVQAYTLEAMAGRRRADPLASFDPAAYAAEREQLRKVEALLAGLGARSRAARLRALLAGDVLARLGLAEEALRASMIYADRAGDFGWWQGENAPLLRALGVADALTLRYALAQQLGRLDQVGRQAAIYLRYADPSIGSSPLVLRWRTIVTELDRYRAARPDSSLLALQRYLLALGPDLSGANCAQKLSAVPAATGMDAFSLRQAQIHQALARRCGELRATEVKVPELQLRALP